MRVLTTTVGPLATVAAASVAAAQSLSAPGPLNLNGSAVVNGVASFANPARVTIACNDGVGPVYRIEGRDVNGRTFAESLAATGATSTAINLFSAVTAIYSDRALVNQITVGNDNGGMSEPIRLDEWADPPLGVQVAVSGTVNFTVQHSFDEGPNSLTNPIPWGSMFWDTSLVPAGAIGGTAGLTFSIPTAPTWLRILLNSGTGSARLTTTQYNVVET